MNRRVSVRAIIVQDGKLFCVRQKDYHTGIAKDFLCTPGGGVDEGEPLKLALEREMLEETGIRPMIGELLYVQQFLDGEREIMDFFFHVTNADAYTNVDLSATTHGSAEIAEARFVDPTAEPILPLFLRTESLSTIGTSPTQVFSYIAREA